MTEKMFRIHKLRGVFFGLLLLISTCLPCWGQETLNVYGPGGPAPAMKEAAALFGQQHDVKVAVTAGPSSVWMEQAKKDADIIFSGSENMMTNFVWAMDGRIDEQSITPLYLRPSTLLVRPGNPKGIKDLKDVLVPGVKILVVNGAGQAGLWEDVAGRLGDMETIKAFRKNIVQYAKNSGLAKQYWIDNPDVDVWLIWTHWQVANPDLADMVVVGKKHRIYRDFGIALTDSGKKKPVALKFIEFLQSETGAGIFTKWGWSSGEGKDK